MLPNVSKLRLDGRPLVTTGEFYPLSADEVAQRNDEVEAFTTEPFREDVEPVDGWHTFRVRSEFPRPDGTYDYKYYRGESLWEYMKRGNRRDPITRGPLWYEDYMELHNKFAPNDPIPAWATGLRRMPTAPAPQPPTFTPAVETAPAPAARMGPVASTPGVIGSLPERLQRALQRPNDAGS